MLYDDVSGLSSGNAFCPDAPTLQPGTCASYTPHPSKEKGCETELVGSIPMPNLAQAIRRDQEFVINRSSFHKEFHSTLNLLSNILIILFKFSSGWPGTYDYFPVLLPHVLALQP